MIINLKGLDASKDFEFDGVTLSIRPYPNTLENVVLKDNGIVVDGENLWQKFNYCLTGWKGLETVDGKQINCTEDNKRVVFDYAVAGIPEFVQKKINELKEIDEDIEKN